jgi:hypothetical protein
MRIASLLFTASLILPAGVQAQRNDDLKNGARLSITESGGRTMKGSVVAISGDSITVAAERGIDTRTFALRDVRSIKVRHVSHVRGFFMGALIGAAAGALSGAIIGGADDSCNFFACGRAGNAAFAGAVFGTGGLALGSLVGVAAGWPSWETINLRGR